MHIKSYIYSFNIALVNCAMNMPIARKLYSDRIWTLDVCKMRIMYMVCHHHLPIGYNISQPDQDGMYDVKDCICSLQPRITVW